MAANSPHFLETVGQAEPLCIKSSIGKYVGCMVNENFEFECRIDDRCNRKYLDSRLAEEIQKLSQQSQSTQETPPAAPAQPSQSPPQTANQTQTAIIPENQTQTTPQTANATQTIPETQQNPPQTNSTLAISGGQAASNISNLSSSNNISNIDNLPQPNSAANATESNSITGNAIDEIIPETDLSSILEPETNTSSPSPEIEQNDNSVNETNNQSTSAGGNANTPDEDDDDSKEIKQKIEKLSKIRSDVKSRSMSVKQAKEQLKLEQLKDIDLNEIESEEDAVYAAKPSKEKAAIQQVQELPYMTKVNGSVIIRLG